MYRKELSMEKADQVNGANTIDNALPGRWRRRWHNLEPFYNKSKDEEPKDGGATGSW